jgi:hypothetical protein
MMILLLIFVVVYDVVALFGSFWFMAVWNDLFGHKLFSAYLLSSPGYRL